MKVGISVFVCLLVIHTGLVKGSCPSECSCSDPYNAHAIDCRSRSLRNIPADFLNDTLHLWLEENNITVIDVQFCKKMPQLHYLYIRDNQISAIPVNTFEDCEQLYSINLQNNKISTLEPFTFMNLPRLGDLYLSNNKIQLLKSYTFINLPNVRFIALNENNISHIEEHAFGTFTSLDMLDLESNPLNCDCTIYPFWSWLVRRPHIDYIQICKRETTICSNGTLVKSLQVDALTKCNPDNFQCFNGGKRLTWGNGDVVCECIGNWTGNFCQESQCISHDCGFGDCYIEPVNGTAQCLCDDRYVNYCQASFILLAELAAVQTAGPTCEDIDENICTKLGQIYSGFCSDSCISKLCRISCGMCPVKCYECYEVDEPRLCTNVTQCPDMDHYCFTTRSFADNFKKIYKLGCAPKSPIKRDLRVDADCCSYDQCNNRFPEEIQGSSYTTSTEEPTETSSTIKECQNIDEDLCTRIAALYPGFCINETCAAAKLCPRMCRQCFRCYSCNEVDNVKDCNVTSVCQGTKQCFSVETLSIDDLRPVVRLGCMEAKTCQRFTASPGIIFGKRQPLQPKGGCCHNDLCNHNLASSLTTKKTTPTPIPRTTTATPRPTFNSCNLNFHSQWPTGYIAHNNFCYLFGTISMSWNNAKNYCTGHCGSLIDFVSDNEMDHTMRYFLHYGPGHLHIDGSYWSAATTHLGSIWVWDSTGNHLTSDFTHDLGTARLGQCGSVHYHLESTSCASRFLPACKTTIRSG